MTAIFMDASALVPLAVDDDPWRPRALQLMNGLREHGRGRVRFVTSNWTFYEALAISHRRSSRLSRLLHAIVRGQMTVYPVRSANEDEALRRFLAWSDQGASVVDHANLLVAQERGCSAIFSFDSDFSPLVGGAGLRLIS